MPRVFLPQILWHSKDNKRCDRVYSIDFQPNAKDEAEENAKNTTSLRLATGGADEFVHIWQITIQDDAPQYTHFVNENQNAENNHEFEQPLSIKIVARLIGHIGEVNAVRWSHDGRVLASGGEDRCIFLWVKGVKQSNMVEDGQYDYKEYWTRTHYFRLAALTRRLSNVVNSICWCPEDRVLSVSTEDGHISLVDTQVEGTGKIRYFDGHTNFAQGVALDPKNELLASLGSDQCMRVWKRRNQKQWKSTLVLKAARDRGDLITVGATNAQMNELETNPELKKYSRYVFMSEELKTFFRRLDWSPDGRLLVAPTGIRYDKSLEDQAGENALDSTVYTLYIFHRKLLNYGIPMLTHQSPTGPFVVVRFCPIFLAAFDKKRQNFYNLLLNAGKNQLKPVKKRQERAEKAQPTATNTINAYFASANATAEPGDREPMDEDGQAAAEKMDERIDDDPLDDDDDTDNEAVLHEADEDALTVLQENVDGFENDTTPNPPENEPQPETAREFPQAQTHNESESASASASASGSAADAVSEFMDDADGETTNTTLVDDQTTFPAGDNAKQPEHENDNGEGEREEAEVKSERGDTVEVKTEEREAAEAETERPEDQSEVKNEDAEEGKAYNLRRKRKSVIPMLLENDYFQTAKEKRKPKVKAEKKEKKEKPKEEEPQDEDYDTDMEEEPSVPRFVFAAGTTDGSLCFFDTNENTGPIAVLKNLHFCPITDIAWSQDGYVCASSSSDGYITFVIFNRRELC